MPAMFKASERCYKRTFGLYDFEALNYRSELKILWDIFRSQNFGFYMIAGSQTIAEDSAWFYLLRSRSQDRRRLLFLKEEKKSYRFLLTFPLLLKPTLLVRSWYRTSATRARILRWATAPHTRYNTNSLTHSVNRSHTDSPDDISNALRRSRPFLSFPLVFLSKESQSVKFLLWQLVPISIWIKTVNEHSVFMTSQRWIIGQN